MFKTTLQCSTRIACVWMTSCFIKPFAETSQAWLESRRTCAHTRLLTGPQALALHTEANVTFLYPTPFSASTWLMKPPPAFITQTLRVCLWVKAVDLRQHRAMKFLLFWENYNYLDLWFHSLHTQAVERFQGPCYYRILRGVDISFMLGLVHNRVHFKNP